MFTGMEWYWWIVILVIIGISVPLKVKFMKWWSSRRREKKNGGSEKWGDEE